jgi:hypothetical protein
MNLFKNKYQKFWDWFETNAESFYEYEDNQDFLFQQLAERLRKVTPSAAFQFGAIEDGRRELILSPDGISDEIQAIKELVAAAPPLKKWNIIAFRQRVEDVGFIEMEGRKLSLDDIFYTYRFNENNRVDLSLFIKGLDGSHRDQIAQAAFILMDATVGEYDVMTKIGMLDFQDYKLAPKKDLFPLTALPVLLDSRQIRDV